MEPAVAVEPEEAGADPAGDPGDVGREEGFVRERQLQLQLDLPPPTPPRPRPPPAAVAVGAAAATASATLLAHALRLRAPQATAAAGAQGPRAAEQVGRRFLRAADGDDDGAGALVGRLRRLEGRHREAATAALCPAQAVLPRESQVGSLYNIFNSKCGKNILQEKSSSTHLVSHEWTVLAPFVRA